ncbi:MAG: hypothetical protein QXS20_01975 [Candidatus Thorarchaeota archaeon]
MSAEHDVDGIISLRRYVQDQREQVETEIQKLLILVTESIRLLSGEGTQVLRGIGGNTDQVAAHLIKSVSRLGDLIKVVLRSIDARLVELCQAARKQ